MKYEFFKILNYRAICGPLKIDLKSRSLVPLIGLNECGKTTVLQAIFAFDHANDNEYEGRHIKDVVNLYTTRSAAPIISAGIRAPKTVWLSLTNQFLSDANKIIEMERGKLTAQVLTLAANKPALDNLTLKKARLTKWGESFSKLIEETGGAIEIDRNIATNKYLIPSISNEDANINDDFSHEIISRMPYILYNDDFQDRPPSSIEIVMDTTKVSNWQQIFANLFKKAATGHTLEETARVLDQRRRDSIVSDVQAVLNNTLAKAWRSFHLDHNKKVKIRLTLTPLIDDQPAILFISIVENIGENERFFQVVDRSKGFLWFYNFVMKTEFNPKNNYGQGQTIYLLDEPGSYLHSAAQTKLCEKLKSISINNGKVIYCTHSPHLLHPDSIPINDIHIVSKNSRKEISVSRLPEYKTTEERLIALQPIFEALQINGFQFAADGRPMLAVEGIYDKYAISLFLPNSDRFNILPCTSANSIVKNIQFLNAFRLDYVAIWDNDPEGRKEFERAKQAFGSGESYKFIKLPAEDSTNCRMEGMFDSSDLERIRKTLQMSDDATYETTMVSLFYAPEKEKTKIVESMSTHSRDKFNKLNLLIEKSMREKITS